MEGILDRDRNDKLKVEESFDFVLQLARRVYHPDE